MFVYLIFVASHLQLQSSNVYSVPASMQDKEVSNGMPLISPDQMHSLACINTERSFTGEILNNFILHFRDFQQLS